MNSDVIPDGNSVNPTDEELIELIFDEILESERDAAELEAAEHEMRWPKNNCSVYLD